MHNPIQYLQRHQVDAHKWDQCIDRAQNGLIYAYSFYLDHMATGWDALVLGDYEAVMPLPKRKKWGIVYAYQPAFTASLGIFGNSLSDALIRSFISAIPATYKWIDMRLNHGNISNDRSLFPKMHNNYVLPLQPSYETLYAGYRENIRRNIKRAQQLGSRYATGIEVKEVIALSSMQMSAVSKLTPDDYTRFENLYYYLQQQGKAVACGVYSAANELVASCVYFFSHRRAYYIMVGNHANGRTLGASHFLIDRFIFDHAGEPLLLDFEGSDIRNLAFFYSSFGAGVEVYPALFINRLPWYARWAK